jgi:hypothetical protein
MLHRIDGAAVEKTYTENLLITRSHNTNVVL